VKSPAFSMNRYDVESAGASAASAKETAAPKKDRM